MSDHSTRGRCVLIGAGGHARVLIDALSAFDAGVDCVAVDADAIRVGSCVDGVPVIGADTMLPSLAADGVASFVVAVGGNGNNRIRQRLFDQAIEAGMRPLSVIHPSSIRSARVTMGDGCQLLAGSIVNPGASLGVNTIVNTGAIVEHDCLIGAHSHVATGARLAGGVILGEGVHVGAGATVLPGRRVGAWAVVGAGAVVTRDVDPGTVVAGVPARTMHELPERA